MELKDILSRCDHTLLRVDSTEAEIKTLCDQGINRLDRFIQEVSIAH